MSKDKHGFIVTKVTTIKAQKKEHKEDDMEDTYGRFVRSGLRWQSAKIVFEIDLIGTGDTSEVSIDNVAKHIANQIISSNDVYPL